MEHNQGFIHSYLTLRKAVGWIGVFVFWIETVALIAFGVSWLTKGGTFYQDTSIESNLRLPANS